MEKTRGQKIISDFYDLHKSCQNDGLDFSDEIINKFLPIYPEVSTFYCDNNTFSTSLIVVMPLDDKLITLCFLDQHSSEIVRMNFSKNRFALFSLGLQKIHESFSKT